MSTKNKVQWLLTWTSGHIPAQTIYYTECKYANGEPGYCAGQDRDKAACFPSAKAALDRWRSMHSFPEEFEHAIEDGSVRAELFEAPELKLS